MKKLQPRYAKKNADADRLIAIIVALAMNHGNQVMAQFSNITFHLLETTYEQYLCMASLFTSHDCIIDTIEVLPIFRTIPLIRNRFMVPLSGRL